MLRPFAHPVTCCCVLLGVVAQRIFEIGQTLSYLQMEAATSSNVGSCWPTTLRPFARGFNLANFGDFITSPLYGRCKKVRL